jgi:hypothetical protein
VLLLLLGGWVFSDEEREEMRDGVERGEKQEGI